MFHDRTLDGRVCRRRRHRGTLPRMLLFLCFALSAQEPPTPPVDAAPVSNSPIVEAPATPAPTTPEPASAPAPAPAPTPAPTTTAEAPRQCTLAVLDLEGGDAMAVSRARALTDVVTGEVSALSPCAVLSRSDIRGILSLEAEKQLLGCATDSESCMAELAGALGADYLVNGTVSRIEGSVLLSLRLTDMKTLKVVRRATDSFAGDDADAIPFVAWLSRKVMTDDANVIGPRPVAAAKGTATVVKQSTVWRPLFWTSFTLFAVSGVVTAGAGGATLVMSDTAKNDFGVANSLQDIGPITADVANVSLYTTAALFVTTAVLFFFPGEEEVTQ
jgi:TolB-like protein